MRAMLFALAPLATPSVRIAVISVIVGGVMGFYAWHSRALRISKTLPAAPASSQVSDEKRTTSASAPRDAARSEPEQPVGPELVAEVRPEIDTLSRLAEIQTNKLGTFRMSLFARDGSLSRGFATLFAVTAEEGRAITDAFNQARSTLELAGAAHATQAVRADAIVVTIPPFQGGAKVYDDVMDRVQTILGPQRSAAFVALMTAEVSKSLNNFGAELRTITITRHVGPTGDLYEISDNHRGPVGAGGRIVQTRFPAGDGLPVEYHWMKRFELRMPELTPTGAKSHGNEFGSQGGARR